MNITTHCSPLTHPSKMIFTFFPDKLTLHGLPLMFKSTASFCVLIDLDLLSIVLEEENHHLPELVLSTEEHALFSRFKYPKRRREWLGGRLAAKTAMLLFSHSPDTLPAALPQLSILANKHGRPEASAFPELALSISHSSQFAAGLAVKGRSCGIDLQKISPKLPDLTSRFTSSKEISLLAHLLPDLDQATLLTMIWTAKEAVKKSILHDQPAIFSGITVQQISGQNHGQHLLSCQVKGYPGLQAVKVHICSPYVFAVTEECHA